jgi:hypothetical protein
MIYHDRIYGKIKITEPVIIRLIQGRDIQRLKGIDQAGYAKAFFPGTEHTRFEHSLGVMNLLRIFRASLNEQIAGLIHDVSHSSFSHCIDYVFKKGSQKMHDYQDSIFQKFIYKTEIPRILRKYKIDVECILDERNFPLKEKNLPDLCADRIDYSLRTAIMFKTIEAEKADYFIKNLTVSNDHWMFKDFKSAEQFANLFFLLNKKYYSGFKSALMFKTVGDCLRYALEKRYISKKDLFTTDKYVLSKIRTFLKKDKQLAQLFLRMNNKIPCVNNPQNYDVVVYCKSRVVDPLCFDSRKIKRVSEIDKNWKIIIEKELLPKKYYLRFSQRQHQTKSNLVKLAGFD